jgi:catechol 2,3-dioxygenase
MSERLISQLAHVELVTPTLEESSRFFTEVMGLDETERDESSVYLRCWGDFSTYTVQLTEGPEPALGHIGWRTEGPEALERAVARLEQAGVGEGWSEGQHGHGPAHRYRGPGGHLQEVFWEVDRYAAPSDKRSAFPARPQRHSPRGAAPRQLDHITINTRRPYDDSEWYRDTLGYRFMEYTAIDDNPDLIVFSMVTTNEKSHDLGLVIDFTEVPGRLNHLAFWVDTVEDVLRAADVLMEAGAHIEFGPGRHGMGEQTYLYFREPGGIRLEINSGGYRNYQPDWQPVKWVPSQGSNTMYRNVSMPDSMTDAFPPAAPARPPEPAVANPWREGAVH